MSNNEIYNSPAAGIQSILDAYRGVNEKRFTKKEEDDSEDNDDKEIGKSSGTTKSNKMEYGKKVVAKPSDCEESVIYEKHDKYTYGKAILDVKNWLIENQNLKYSDYWSLQKQYEKFISNLHRYLDEQFRYGVDKDHPKRQGN